MTKNLRRILSIALAFIFILLICYFIVDFDRQESKMVISNVNDIIDVSKVEDRLSVNKIQELQEYYNNSDIKGIISIEGLDNFSYPVVQGYDNDYYLNHDYYKRYNAYGAIYADYRVDLDNSKKVLIFGHSSIKRNVPFNVLENYENQDYYDNHKYITLETRTDSYRYEIFSVYVETSDFTYMNMIFDSEDEWYAHIMNIKNKSLYSIDVELTKEDDILIIQTCSTNSKYRDYSKKYLLVVLRRVK